MTVFYANPYDITYAGFYFNSEEDLDRQLAAHPAEEFSVEFIEGTTAQSDLFRALGGGIEVIPFYYDELEDLPDYRKVQIITLLDRGFRGDLDDLLEVSEDLMVSEGTLVDKANEDLDEGIVGEEQLKQYFDAELYARDLQENFEEQTYMWGPDNTRVTYTVSRS